MKPETQLRLVFIESRIAWFCTDPDTAWGDDWNDAPHDCNAGWPYRDRGGDWYRVAFDPGGLEVCGIQFGPAEREWGVLSVQQINEGVGPWLAEFGYGQGEDLSDLPVVNTVPGLVTVPEFVALVEKSGGEVFFPEAVGS